MNLTRISFTLSAKYIVYLTTFCLKRFGCISIYCTLCTNRYCYIVGVKVQFFCIAIGQKRITRRSAKRRVYSNALATRQPVHNKTFYWPANYRMELRRSEQEVNCACPPTAKFESSFLVLLFWNFKISVRFASRSVQDIAELRKDKESKSLTTSAKLTMDLLKQFCAAKGLTLDLHPS